MKDLPYKSAEGPAVTFLVLAASATNLETITELSPL